VAFVEARLELDRRPQRGRQIPGVAFRKIATPVRWPLTRLGITSA